MRKVIIKQIIHNQNNIVLFAFKPDENLISTLKQQIQHFHWNQELQSWVSLSYPTLKKELFQLLRGKYWLDYSGMELKTRITEVNTLVTMPPLAPLSELHKIHLEKFKNYLLSRRYSPSTIKTYTETVSTFLRFFISKPISEINHNDLIVFNNEYIIQKIFPTVFKIRLSMLLNCFFKL